MKKLAYVFLLVVAVCVFVQNRIAAEQAGLIGGYYEGPDLTRFDRMETLDSLEMSWSEADERGREWSSKWQGLILAPANGEITFHAETNQALALTMDGNAVLNIESGEKTASGSVKMVKGREYPITVIYNNDAVYDGYLKVKWSWAGQKPTSIPSKHLRHTSAQAEALEQKAMERWAEQFAGTKPDLTIPVENVIVFYEPGRFAGWPANNGIWIWDNEILVGFELGVYQLDDQNDHAVDFDKEKHLMLARSLDGGRTWKIENPDPFLEDLPLTNVPEKGIRFDHPDFAMRCSGDRFIVSYDRGKTWQGAYPLPRPPVSDYEFELSARTDYIVNGPQECFFFLSIQNSEMDWGLNDRAFMASTSAGGKTIDFVSWINPEIHSVRGVMPSTVRCSPTKLVTALRRKAGGDQFNWISVFESNDNGQNWSLLSKVADTDLSRFNGNPPSLVRLEDGRLVCAYGYRSYPFGIRARISEDEGKTWSKEIGLRQDGARWDLGYCRMVQRPDGKLVTIYYHTTQAHPENHIAATIWSPPEHIEIDESRGLSEAEIKSADESR